MLTCLREAGGLNFYLRFPLFHTVFMQVAKSLGRLHTCAYSSEPLLLADAISTIISCTGPYI